MYQRGIGNSDTSKRRWMYPREDKDVSAKRVRYPRKDF